MKQSIFSAVFSLCRWAAICVTRAGTFAKPDLHPLEGAAFELRTPCAEIRALKRRKFNVLAKPVAVCRRAKSPNCLCGSHREHDPLQQSLEVQNDRQ